jgi:hypothetical protein
VHVSLFSSIILPAIHTHREVPCPRCMGRVIVPASGAHGTCFCFVLRPCVAAYHIRQHCRTGVDLELLHHPAPVPNAPHGSSYRNTHLGGFSGKNCHGCTVTEVRAGDAAVACADSET